MASVEGIDKQGKPFKHSVEIVYFQKDPNIGYAAIGWPGVPTYFDAVPLRFAAPEFVRLGSSDTK